MLKKDLANLKEHNDRVWRGYEQDVENLRDKLCKSNLLNFRNTLLVFIGAERDKNEKLESQLELSNTFKDKNTNDLQETQTESSKLSKILLPHKNRKQAVGGSEWTQWGNPWTKREIAQEGKPIKRASNGGRVFQGWPAQAA